LTTENNLKLAQGGESSQIVDDAYENMTAFLQSTQNNLTSALTKADNILGIDNTYVNDKFEFLKSTGSELLNQSYFYDADIPREELYSYNLEHLLQIKEILFHVYARAKELALEYKEKERLLDEKLEKIFERHVG